MMFVRTPAAAVVGYGLRVSAAAESECRAGGGNATYQSCVMSEKGQHY